MRATVEDGLFSLAGDTYRAVIGRGGVRHDKREGDGATPSGVLALRRVFYRADRVNRPQAAVPVEPVAPEDGWCDDPHHADYNRHVRLPHPARCEVLWRADAVYDIIGVLGWNDAPAMRGRGSAIFLHVARPDHAPTDGCVSLELNELVEVLALGLTEILVKHS